MNVVSRIFADGAGLMGQDNVVGIGGLPTGSNDDCGRDSLVSRCRALLDADEALRQITPAGLLSHEARLIMQLAVNDGTIVKEAALSSWLSDRAFYELSKRLERNGMIRQKASPKDLRTRLMFLSDGAWNGLSQMMESAQTKAAANCAANSDDFAHA